MLKSSSNILSGIASAPGLAYSECYVYKKEYLDISKVKILDFEEAKQNLLDALQKSKKELLKVFSLAVDKLGQKRAAIFEAQIMILDDPILIGNILDRMKNELLNPEYIVNDEIAKYQEIMNASDELYMKERSLDLEDIKNRIIKNLQNKKWLSKITGEVIVVTDTLTPADTVIFAKAKVKAFVTDFGGLTSHAAILARSLNIPAVVGLHDATKKIKHGDKIIVDGFNGLVIIEPNDKQIKFYSQKIEKLSLVTSELEKSAYIPAKTLDNKKIELLGNLDLVEEIDLMKKNGAEGIGLVRTEQLFIESMGFPDENEQYLRYTDIAQKLYPYEVVIRIFDTGGDKVLPFDVKEANPFLGWRGVRFLLDNPDLLKTQIMAIQRANQLNNIKLLIPMVTSLNEIRKVKDVINECYKVLQNDGNKNIQKIKIGAMIEIPSAAVMTEEFAEEVDFLSIGTNDLIQFLLAVDRGNDIISSLYQEFHPAVVKTLSYIIKTTKSLNKKVKVSLCGEMAADTLATPLLIGLGLDSFSISPAALPQLKQVILNIDYSEAKDLADKCLKLKTEEEINSELQGFFNTKISNKINNLFEDSNE
ncbi:MAG TPA: phosphoenolpyruvate--protein phosphotransferase [Melioribacteraceae bacterium]|nr:phosphoenolpyruvate--protein phosphotransferase [Melioribacteraceae bacterium]